jgi:hypothetical protein
MQFDGGMDPITDIAALKRAEAAGEHWLKQESPSTPSFRARCPQKKRYARR